MATNPSYKPNEGKREEFRRYLEKTGVMDALTKVLVLLYEEPDKPDDALLFILNTLSRQTGNSTVDEMKAQIKQLQDQVTQLQEENQKLETGGAEVPEIEGEVDTEVPPPPEEPGVEKTPSQ